MTERPSHLEKRVIKTNHEARRDWREKQENIKRKEWIKRSLFQELMEGMEELKKQREEGIGGA